MRSVFFGFLLLITGPVSAQVLNSTSLELVGNPSWYRTISLNQDGVVMILKEDQTRFKVVRFDVQLKKIWEQDLFIDTEKAPAAIRLYNGRLGILFSETSGMYYQLLDFNLKDGECTRRGFEIRDFFQDKKLLMYSDKALLIGNTEKGLAYYQYDFREETGKLIQTEFLGNIEVGEVRAINDSTFTLLAAEKIMGYTNEAKKKGGYIKSSQIVLAAMNLDGKMISKKTVVQRLGKFPMNAKWNDNFSLISGTYQDPKGEKGIYISFSEKIENKPVFFSSFSDLIGDQLSSKEKDRFLKSAQFYTFSPGFDSDKITFGGIFYTPNYQNISTGRGSSMFGGSQREQFQAVFAGMEFSSAYVLSVSHDGSLLTRNAVVVNQTLSQALSPLAINQSGAVAYLSKGKLLIKNFNIGSKPVVYQLTEENAQDSPYIAGYNQVSLWYDNVFLAVGSQSKREVLQTEKSAEKPKRKKKRSTPFTQIRKTYYITSVSAGQAG